MARSTLPAVRALDDVGVAARDSDESLIARARIGDRGAFAELWQRHARSGIRVARQVSSSIDADDLVAEAYTRIFARVLAGGGPDGAFRPYLYTTIRNLASRWGQASREVQVENIAELEDPRGEEDPAYGILDRTLTAEAFRTLPQRWQAVLWYTEVEGMDPHEVAPLLGLSANGVAALSYRAREGLRKAWLQAHISHSAPEGECRWTVARLGDYTRHGLTGRERRRMEAHLDACATCARLSQEVDEVGSGLAMVLLPMIFGATIGGSVLAAFSAPGAATAATATAPAVAAGVGATLPVSLVATITLAIVVSGGLGGSGGVGATRGADPGPQRQTAAQPYSAVSHAVPDNGGPLRNAGGPGGVQLPGLTNVRASSGGLGAAVDAAVGGAVAAVGGIVGGVTGTVGAVTDAAGGVVQGVTSPLNTVVPSLPLLSEPAPEPPATGGVVVSTVTPLLSNTLGITVPLPE